MTSRRDADADVRDIPENIVEPKGRLRLGTLLAEIGRRFGLTDEDFAIFEQVRDKTPAEPPRFDTGRPND